MALIHILRDPLEAEQPFERLESKRQENLSDRDDREGKTRSFR